MAAPNRGCVRLWSTPIRVAMPMPNPSTGGRWRYEKRRSVCIGLVGKTGLFVAPENNPPAPAHELTA
jgi:hypothetical protein